MSFNEKVYDLCKKIPKGKVSTYKDIARALSSKAYRAVGNALNKNKDCDIIPCYKIVNSNGNLGGYALGLKEKNRRLKNDGIQIKNNKIDLNRYLHKFWKR